MRVAAFAQQGMVLLLVLWWLQVLSALAVVVVWRGAEVRVLLQQQNESRAAWQAALAGVRAAEQAWPVVQAGRGQRPWQYQFTTRWLTQDNCQRRFYLIDVIGVAQRAQVHVQVTRVDMSQALSRTSCVLPPNWQHWQLVI